MRGERRLTESEDIADELFQINYLEPVEQAAERFGSWLEGLVTIGLDRWRAGLSTSARHEPE